MAASAQGGARRRLSPEKQQEQLSRNQLCEALQGWICNSLSEDFGEDFLVSIYDDGRSTGLTFQLQLKSVKGMRGRLRQNTPSSITYRLAVADLEHWEDASPPVIVVIWDVLQRRGCWQDVPAIIAALTSGAQTWRGKETVSVQFPLGNTLEAAGREALRQRVGRLVLPAISQGKTLELTPTFTFPNTGTGRQALAALKCAIEDGETITIPRDNIDSVRFSTWWERVFGRRTPESITISPSPTDQRLDLFVEALGRTEVERFPLQLRRTKGGTKRRIFANEDSRDPARLTIHVDDIAEEIGIKINFHHPHSDVNTCLILTKLLRLLQGGGALRIVGPGGQLLGELAPNLSQLPGMIELEAWERLLTMLVLVQARTARYGQFQLPSRITTKELREASRLSAICQTGLEETIMTFGMTLTGPATFPADLKGDLAIELDPFGDLEVFGVVVPLGKVRLEFLDAPQVIARFQSAQRKGRTRITLKDTRVRLRYLEWIPPARGPAHTASNRAISRGGDQRPIRDKAEAASTQLRRRRS